MFWPSPTSFFDHWIIHQLTWSLTSDSTPSFEQDRFTSRFHPRDQQHFLHHLLPNGNSQSQNVLVPTKASFDDIVFHPSHHNPPSAALTRVLATKMAPHHGGDLHQVRDDDDSSDSYHHPVIMFFSVLMLCVCIVAPVSWMLWLMRNDNRGGGCLFLSFF